MVFRNQVNVMLQELPPSTGVKQSVCRQMRRQLSWNPFTNQIFCVITSQCFFFCLSLYATVTFMVADGLLFLFPQPPQTLRLVSLHFQQEVTRGMSSVNLKRRIILRINREPLKRNVNI